jgi:penicillin-binding protein 2
MLSQMGRISSTPIRVAMVIALGVFAALAIAALRLQVVEYSQYQSMSRDNYVVQVTIKAPRGDIVDCNGALIAGSRQAFSICAVPRSILKNAREVRILSRILGMEEDDIRSRLAPMARSYRPTSIVRDADFETLSVIEESFADLPDVMVIADPVRSYPLGRIFSHMIGYVGEATEEEIKAAEVKYASGDFIGKAGIEKKYEVNLKGRDGVRYVRFTPGGGSGPLEVEDLPERSPRPGMRIRLHADKDLQQLACDLLEERPGCIIVMDVKSGGVRALASSPTFDPDLFAVGISNEDWSRIITCDGKPLINRALQSAYPPGSTYKIVTAGMALEEGVISAHTRFQPCRGSYRFGNRTFRCWKEEGHGSLDLVGAIQVSCDVYFYQLGERLSADVFGSYAERWRLASPTGIDLPGEVTGLVPDAAYYDSTYGKGGWTKGLMLNLAIGQGEVLLTPLELLCFVCGVANGGAYYSPRCVDRAEAGARTEEFKGSSVSLEISPSTLETLQKSMLAVVEGDRGTGRSADLPDLEVAGKTGTAQNPHGDDHAFFVCFAPFDKPEIAILVLLENAGHGGSQAAPLARLLLAQYFGMMEPEEVACE